jgi:hypothetical protein
MRSLINRRIDRHRAVWSLRAGVSGVTTDDSVKRVEHCDVHNRHCSTGTPWSELFSEDAVLARRDWSVIETGGINRDQVPTMNGIESLPWADKRWDVCSGVKQRAKRRTKPIIQNGGETQSREYETGEQYRKFFHMISREFYDEFVFTSEKYFPR